MARLRVGLMDPVMAARPTVDTVTRANYIGAVAKSR
jgi:phthiodiolone/phenolphthiodiolone dimycocerosates ketoreductase